MASDLSPIAITKLLSISTSLSKFVVRQVVPLAGDASLRNYFRLTIAPQEGGSPVGKIPTSLIMLQYGGAKGPAFRQQNLPSQEEALRMLTPYFHEHGLPVPRLLLHLASEHLFFFDDFGDRNLAAVISGQRDEKMERLQDTLGGELVEPLFKRAIDIIQKIQTLPVDSSCVAFQRWLEFENYRAEAQEFLDFYAPQLHFTKGALEMGGKLLDAVSEIISSFPRALSHFDFQSHNLMVQDDGSLGMLDYQDTSLTSPARDIVSLINDRDMDHALGRTRHEHLLRYYQETLKPGPQFAWYYDVTLLHWDLRVVGRFIKLCQTKKTERYRQWVPGTLRRLGRTLLRTYREIHGMENLLELLVKHSPEVREGTEDPWPFPKK